MFRETDPSDLGDMIPFDPQQTAHQTKSDATLAGKVGESVGQATRPEVTGSSVLVEPHQEAGFLKKIEALNKKAKTFGLSPITVKSKEVLIYEYHSEPTRGGGTFSYLKPVPKGTIAQNPVQILRIEIEFPLIKLGNWLVVAKLEKTPSGNLQFLVTRDQADAQATAAYASEPVHCEHCDLKRTRKDGYVLRDLGHGGYKQVGASCLQDFTGIDPAAALFMARMWSVISAYEDDFNEFSRSGRINAVETRRFLAAVSFLSQTFGFVSAAMARDRALSPTYSDAMQLGNLMQEDEGLRAKYLASIDNHRKVADDVLAWIACKPVQSAFDSNLKLLLGQDALSADRKHLAFAAAAVAMFYKTTEALKEKPNLKHVGTEGQKMSASLNVHRTIDIETPYGRSTLVLLRDDDGNHLTWKTAACPRELIENEGHLRFSASFKVKKHDNYKAVPQTIITHLKVVP